MGSWLLSWFSEAATVMVNWLSLLAFVLKCVCACVYMYYVQKTTFKRRVSPPSAMGQVLGIALGLLYFISDKGSACQDIIHY